MFDDKKKATEESCSLKGVIRYDQGMTLSLSDHYETMDRKFREKVPKTHYDIVRLMELFEMFKKNPMGSEMKNKVINNLILKNDTSVNRVKCEMCYSHFLRREQLYKHIWKFHDKDNLGKINPYTWFTDDCIMGCGFNSKTPSRRHMHLVIFHSHDQLSDWSINREYLKLVEGLINKKTFFKRCKGSL